MKINSLFNKKGGLILTGAVLIASSLTSCLKDNGPGSVNFADSPALIDFQYTAGSATPYTAAVLPLAAQTYSGVEVALSVSSITLGSAVTATIVEDDSSIPSGYLPLPTADYTLPNGGKVTIPAGQSLVKLPIIFQGNAIDFTKSYALALKLTSPSGAQLTSNLNVAIVKIKLKSIYETTYDVISGNTTRYNGANVASGVRDVFQVAEPTIYLATVDASTVNGQVGSSSFGLTAAYTISGTTVTVGADPAGTIGTTTFDYIQGNNNGASSYDPATKTLIIHISYLNAAGALRTVDMKMVGE